MEGRGLGVDDQRGAGPVGKEFELGRAHAFSSIVQHVPQDLPLPPPGDVREDRLLAIENNPALATILRKRFPGGRIITGDAWDLDTLLAELPQPVESVGAVISSLPLLNFPKEQADALARKIRAVLEPRGRWVQYSYQIVKDRSRGGEDFKLLASKIVWLNLPPARVSVYQK